MTNQTSNIVGFCRKGSGNVLKICISKQAIAEAETYTTRDGKEVVRLILSLERLKKVLEGQRECAYIGLIMKKK